MMSSAAPTSTPGASSSRLAPAVRVHSPRRLSSGYPIASTVNSSTSTLHNDPNAPPHLSAALEAELARDERRIEAYGADDPASPAPKHLGDPVSAVPADEVLEKADPNLVGWDGPDDPENPQNWSALRKWSVTFLVVLLSINVTFASSAPSSAVVAIASDLHVSEEVGFLVTSTFLIGYVFGPLVWGPGSELVGRRPVMILTVGVYTILHLGQALAPNIATLLVTRFLGGFCATAPLTNSGGLIADIFDPVGRGLATSLFTASVFLGPVLGPIVSAFVVESSLGWRWVFWIMMIFAGVCWVVSAVFLPETYAPVLLAQKARRMRKADPVASKDVYAEYERQDWSVRAVLRRSIFRPFEMLAQEPILVLITIYMAIIYGLLYALFEALPVIFIGTHGFSLTQASLVFIGVGIGTTLGSITNWWLSRSYPALSAKWRGFPPPEARLTGAMIAAPALVVGCLWLGWTGQYEAVPWIVPALATVLVGFAISLVFMSFLAYIVDTYLQYSASAFAANTAVRSAVAAGFPLFTTKMFAGLGVGGACTLLGGIGLLLAPSPFLFYKYGPRIRGSSRFAPCADLKIAEEMRAAELSEKAVA